MIGEATDEDVAYVVDHGMELNIRSLKEAMAHRSGEETADSASGDAQEETAESARKEALHIHRENWIC